MPYLSQEQIDFYHTNGYLVIENFWNEETVEVLKNKMENIVVNADLGQIKTIFTAKDQDRKPADEYFLSSGREIRFFWEEKAWEGDQFVATDKKLAINKVGHGIHDLDEDFEKISYEGRIGNICAELGMEKPLVAQSMYIFKQPRIGGAVNAHQDGAFLYTEPQSCIGFWWPLHDCTKENGCLWAVPGSHSLPVSRRYRRLDPPNIGTEFIPKEPVVFDITDAVPLETKKGTLVVLHAALVHLSQENLSDFPRHAYSIHIVDGKEGVVYPADNWLQRPVEFPFREVTNRV
jgi:phytanoyl-CoA hydroxylase